MSACAGPRYVYFVRAGETGPVKIGCSNKPANRLLQIGEWVPFKLELIAVMPGSYALETAVHNMFAPEWSHGEWFHQSDRLRQFIADIQAGRPVEIKPHPEAYNAPRRVAIRTKKQWTRRIARAEMAAWNCDQRGPDHHIMIRTGRRPAEIAAITNHYQNSKNPPPTPEQEAILWDYIEHLAQAAA